MIASARTLKILAALVWYTGALVLLLKGTSLLQEAEALEPERRWSGLGIGIGVLVGALKGLTIFRRSCHRNLNRIDGLEQPMIWGFFRPWFFLALALMIAVGATLSRMADGSYGPMIGVAVLDLAIGTALLSSSYVFWKRRAFG